MVVGQFRITGITHRGYWCDAASIRCGHPSVCERLLYVPNWRDLTAGSACEDSIEGIDRRSGRACCAALRRLYLVRSGPLRVVLGEQHSNQHARDHQSVLVFQYAECLGDIQQCCLDGDTYTGESVAVELDTGSGNGGRRGDHCLYRALENCRSGVCRARARLVGRRRGLRHRLCSDKSVGGTEADGSSWAAQGRQYEHCSPSDER